MSHSKNVPTTVHLWTPPIDASAVDEDERWGWTLLGLLVDLPALLIQSLSIKLRRESLAPMQVDSHRPKSVERGRNQQRDWP